VRLVADANVLLSAVIGGRARLVLHHPDVHEYLAVLAEKRRLRLDTLLLTLAALPVTVVERSEYQHHVKEATRRMQRRDPNDADVLALSLHLGHAVWSNDNDFDDAGVKWHTTAELLKTLGVRS
jgi:predicted nucleic acid-binding protein